MSQRRMITIDGNEAAASVAHRLSEVIVIYPITPSSPMGEFSDEWSAQGMTNIWGSVPDVTEMQSEGGAAGAMHGSLQAGAMSTTFTASQGLLLMIPNMYKIAGELTPFAMHVSARSLAAQALSIFGDHSDVMACRQTGFAMLASNSPQEAHDLACISHVATLRSRVPFLHFFDGFRTSHEVAKIEELTDDDLRQMINTDYVKACRDRALTPDRPVIRGTAQNPDVYFQGRETVNNIYKETPAMVEDAMECFAGLTGRRYNLFDYVGAPDAERVVVLMGSGAGAVEETVEALAAKGEKVGAVKVRLYRPFSVEHLAKALPATVKAIAVLDRTKEPGAVGEPLYTDVVAGLREAADRGLTSFATQPSIIRGRYGLSSKEFNPAMVKAIFDELAKDEPKTEFVVGINDDVSNLSLAYDESFDVEPDDVVRAMFYGLGADGTVGANKNSIKIIGEETDNFAQGYFVYDSKKSGGVTVSHLRFGPRPINSTYQIKKANFVACHQWSFLDKIDMLDVALDGGTFLLNSSYPADQVWDMLPCPVQEDIIAKKLKFYAIDAYEVAKKTGMGGRINTIMQTCFFAISGVLERDEAIAKIKGAIKKTYGIKGEDVVQQNYKAVDETLANLHEINVPDTATSTCHLSAVVSPDAPDFVRNVTAMMMAGKGDDLPVSAISVDGTWPTGTTKWEKRAIAQDIPVWNSEFCIQCGKCSLTCPHAAVRINVYDADLLGDAPATFKSIDAKGKDWKGQKFTVQVAPEDCTGCALCAVTCPGRNKSNSEEKALMMAPLIPIREEEAKNFDFFLGLPRPDRKGLKFDIKGSQLREPLFEFSGCCAGCGETPYVKLLSQLFGDRMYIANATGCSSIYGGNLPTTPYTVDAAGRGPTWANSLFEDNAEFGMGFRLAVDKHEVFAKELLTRVASQVGDELVDGIMNADQSDEAGINAQRERVAALKDKLSGADSVDARMLVDVADYLVEKSVWILGGDGWAYDIGYGGLDHVIASGKNINILVMDTEVYSNTGGQQSKATPIGASAKFASAGKPTPKKDLGMIAMTYGNVYVAQVAMGAKDAHTIKVLQEANSYPGCSLVIAYSHCIAHGFEISQGNEHQKQAVDSGHWPLYRFDPRRSEEGLNPLQLDSSEPKVALEDYIYSENRYRIMKKLDPERAAALAREAQKGVNSKYRLYKQLSELETGSK